MKKPEYQTRRFSLIEATRELGISSKTLYTRLKKLDITPIPNTNGRRLKILTGAQLKEIFALELK